MSIEERLENPLYISVDKWLTYQGSSFNVFNASEEEVFNLAMQEQFPGISIAVTNLFLQVAKQLVESKSE